MTERQISDGLCAFLRKEGLSFVRARTDKKSGIQEGWPDVTVVYCGRVWLCELKTRTGKLSKKQVECHAKLRANGNTVRIARDAAEAIAAVQTWLGVEKLTGEAPRRSECPLDNERAAELIAGATDLSGGVESRHAARCAEDTSPRPTAQQSSGGVSTLPRGSSAPPAQNLWIAEIFGVDYVCGGENFPGGLMFKVRGATPQDIRDLPRR